MVGWKRVKDIQKYEIWTAGLVQRRAAERRRHWSRWIRELWATQPWGWDPDLGLMIKTGCFFIIVFVL